VCDRAAAGLLSPEDSPRSTRIVSKGEHSMSTFEWDLIHSIFTRRTSGVGYYAQTQRIDSQDMQIGALGGDMLSLQTALQQQQAQIGMLAAAVMTLVEALGERGAIDPAAIRERIEAKLQPPASTAPMAGCVRCGRQVPVSSTTVTPDGTVCDACLAAP
jgi:hypothetical protein